MIKRIVALLILSSLMILVAVDSAAADSSWSVQYWNNKTLSGAATVGWTESTIDHDWGHGSPHQSINNDNFSAKWTRTESFAPGTYRFTATMDDGMRVWVDGNKIIDSWYDSQVHSLSADMYLTSGNHTIVVEYYDAGAEAVAKFSWALVSGGGGTWQAEYFNNNSLVGAPTVVRQESQISYNWAGSPVGGINADMFSVRWTGSIPVDSGTYRFNVTADDGVRLWVNGVQVVNAWVEQPATTFTVDVNLSSGSVPVRMEYFENGGSGVASLSWSKISTTPTPPTTPTITDWRGEYFNNISLDGSPIIVRNDEAVNFVWGSSSPSPNVINADRFSARWSNTLNLTAGTYTFTAYADDGVRVWVNNQLIIDEWDTHELQSFSNAITVSGGATPVVVEYFEFSGLAEARLTWTRNGSTTNPTPPTSNGVPQTATMTGANYLNVRSGPGIDFEPITYLSNGQVVELLGRDSGNYWMKIRTSSGTVGWTSSRYLSANAPFVNLPITQ